MADNKVNFLRGTSAEYATVTKDNDTFYYTTDNGKLYLGNKEITSAGVTEEQLVNALAEHNISTDAHAALFQGGETVEKASAYTLDNAVDYPIVDMRIYGKSTQDGVPTPDAPVDIVSVGDSGTVGVTACGKNYAHGFVSTTKDGVTFTVNEDGSVSAIGECSKQTEIISQFTLPKGEYILSGAPSGSSSGNLDIYLWNRNSNTVIARAYDGSSFTKFSLDTFTLIEICLRVNVGTVNTIFYPQIELGDTATDYEPYIGSTVTLPYTLQGIPVDADGNYTDSNGQQWIADEVIYNADGTGKIVKNTMSMLLDGSDDEEYVKGNTTEIYETFSVIKSLGNNLPIKYTENMMCNNTAIMSGFKTTVNDFALHCGNNLNIVFGLNMGIKTVKAVKTWLSAHPTTIIYPLKTPQEINLTAEEMTALKALQTFDGVANISNDGDAEMQIKYCTNSALSEYVLPVIDGLAENTAAKNHTHTVSEITDFPEALPADGGNADTVGNVAVSSSDEVGLRKISAGTTDLTAGTSALETGTIYLVYE